MNKTTEKPVKEKKVKVAETVAVEKKTKEKKAKTVEKVVAEKPIKEKKAVKGKVVAKNKKAILPELYEVLRRPILTEQSTKMIEEFNRYTFEVSRKSNKVEIKKAVEAIFNVKVLSVNTINVLPKFKRMGKHEGYTSAYKKAIVKLADGQKIDAFTV